MKKIIAVLLSITFVLSLAATLASCKKDKNADETGEESKVETTQVSDTDGETDIVTEDDTDGVTETETEEGRDTETETETETETQEPETKPVVTKPVVTKPVVTKPVETKPAVTTPPETEASETEAPETESETDTETEGPEEDVPHPDEALFIGKWETKIDLTDAFNEIILGQELMSYGQFEGLEFTGYYNFRENNTVLIEDDMDSLETIIEKMRTQMIPILEAFIADIIEENDLGITVDEYAQMYLGFDSVAEYVDDYFSSITPESLYESYEAQWAIIDGMICVSEDIDTEPTIDDGYDYEFVGSTIELSFEGEIYFILEKVS